MTEIIMPGEPPEHRGAGGPGAVEEWREGESRWSIEQLVSAFLAGLNSSERTRTAYRRDLGQYLEWCGEHGVDPLAAGLPELNMYGFHLAHAEGRNRWGPTGKPLAPQTQARKLNVVSSFYRYLVRSGVVAANPARELDRPRYDRTHSPTRGLTEPEATAMLALVRSEAPRTLDPRCAALCLHLMVDIGARVTEVCNIDLDDLGHRDGMRVVTLRMKGRKVRTRPIPSQLSGLVDAWRVRRPVEADPRALLVDRKGRRVTADQVTYLIRRVAKAAGVPDPERVTPHSTRHGFNRIAKARGATAEQRQRALGHASLATTQLYDAQEADLGSDPAHLVAAATFTPHDDTTDNDTTTTTAGGEETGDEQ